MKRLLASLAIATLALSPMAFAQHAASAAGPAFRDACATSDPGAVRCFAIQALVAQPATTSPSFPSGYHPADLQEAYNVAGSTAGSGMTVAVVDAYDDPNAESDLQVYRNQFGLPPCTSANGCFEKVNQYGQPSPLPPANATGGWQTEESLDVDMVSAICPNCHILLVEANNNSNTNLGIAVDGAVTAGANAISNSYGGRENSLSASYDQYYQHQGVAVTVSSGDSGYAAGPQYPAASQYVTAVGGTSLYKTTKVARGWWEKAWSGAGSGCSNFQPKPAWQQDASCTKRTIADVSAVADPATGVSVYDTFYGAPGWQVYGGTSVASPIIASIYALAGNTSQVVYGSYLYLNGASLYDVRRGSNGSCGGTYLCKAGLGYDGPTGLGTANGAGSF